MIHHGFIHRFWAPLKMAFCPEGERGGVQGKVLDFPKNIMIIFYGSRDMMRQRWHFGILYGKFTQKIDCLKISVALFLALGGRSCNCWGLISKHS